MLHLQVSFKKYHTKKYHTKKNIIQKKYHTKKISYKKNIIQKKYHTKKYYSNLQNYFEYFLYYVLSQTLKKKSKSKI
jgi:hypothetical protein